MSVERPLADAADRRLVSTDSASRRWVEQLRADHPRHEEAVARLHDVLRRAALHEIRRRRAQLPGLAGPELDDLAHQCADDALVNILARIGDFKGLSRFTTWAYKFAIFEVSTKARLAAPPTKPGGPRRGRASRQPGAPAERTGRAS